MSTPTVQSLADRSACYICATQYDAERWKTALLAQILLRLDPGADVSAQGIASRMACFDCQPAHDQYAEQAAALAAITGQ